MNVIGDVRNKACILIDDLVDSGGTLRNAADALKSRGALSVDVYVTHGVLSGTAVAGIENSSLESLTMTDSILATDEARHARRIRHFTIAPILAEAMQRISDETSVSSLFD
jgi:ribose-phosphate pyrophosphokinase